MPGGRSDTLLRFWFGAEAGMLPHAVGFERDAEFDEALRRHFLGDHERAAAGAYDHWAASARPGLALILLLDQLPRHLFRGTERAYATDAKARKVASGMVDQALDQALSPVERWFVYLPFEHSEDLADQERSVALFAGLADHEPGLSPIDHARRRREVIRRFGRFPHRNAFLGQESTAEEVAFLAEPGSSF
jgi:uncharacterized protein (DUF924 family)